MLFGFGWRVGFRLTANGLGIAEDGDLQYYTSINAQNLNLAFRFQINSSFILVLFLVLQVCLLQIKLQNFLFF